MSVVSKKYAYIAILVLFVGIYLYFQSQERKYASILTFKDCVNAGFPILETYPEQCKMPGKTFVNDSQLKATSTPSAQIEDDFLNHTYLLNGQSIEIKESVGTSSSTSSFVFQGISYTEYFNDDQLKDKVFIVERVNGTAKEYYVLLALGLYNGGTAPANAIVVGREVPLSITKNTDGRLQVQVSCGGPVPCYKNFTVKDGILEQSN